MKLNFFFWEITENVAAGVQYLNKQQRWAPSVSCWLKIRPGRHKKKTHKNDVHQSFGRWLAPTNKNNFDPEFPLFILCYWIILSDPRGVWTWWIMNWFSAWVLAVWKRGHFCCWIILRLNDSLAGADLARRWTRRNWFLWLSTQPSVFSEFHFVGGLKWTAKQTWRQVERNNKWSYWYWSAANSL